jgi:hypothetical protein
MLMHADWMNPCSDLPRLAALKALPLVHMKQHKNIDMKTETNQLK